MNKHVVFGKFNVTIYLGKFYFCFGWFRGEPFKVFQLDLFDFNYGCSIIYLNTCKVVFSIGFTND